VNGDEGIKVNVSFDCSTIFDEDAGCSSEDCSGATASVSRMIKDQILYEIKSEIMKRISDESKQAIKDEAYKQTQGAIISHVEREISKCLVDFKFIPQYEKAPKTIPEYVRERLEVELQARKIAPVIEQIASQYVATLKERFDKFFASTLLDKMMKANLLRDDAIAKLLLNQNEG
jgi:anaerobic ribonucleoside-triphosphate reductase